MQQRIEGETIETPDRYHLQEVSKMEKICVSIVEKSRENDGAKVS
jgi:hypothetical protein